MSGAQRDFGWSGGVDTLFVMVGSGELTQAAVTAGGLAFNHY